MSFGSRARAALDAYGPLCVGIDPHASLLEEWGVGDDVRGLERFSAACVEAFAGQVGFVKPQSAFFERFGSAGVRVLEDTIAGLRHTGTLVVLDVKRGDIGSTAAAYADAYLDPASPWAQLHAGLMKAFPGQMVNFIDLTRDEGKLLFSTWSDRNPGTFYVLDLKAKAPQLLFKMYEDLDPALMSPTLPIEYNNRAGVPINDDVR
jgi:orotidine 5'-phosphate decarboxylase subfamily 2